MGLVLYNKNDNKINITNVTDIRNIGFGKHISAAKIDNEDIKKPNKYGSLLSYLRFTVLLRYRKIIAVSIKELTNSAILPAVFPIVSPA